MFEESYYKFQQEKMKLEAEQADWKNNSMRAANIAKLDAAKELLKVIDHEIIIPEILAQAYIEGFVENDNAVGMLHQEGASLNKRILDLSLRIYEIEYKSQRMGN